MATIDIIRGNLFISEIMWAIRNSPAITSEKKQAEAMGLSVGTVNKLLNPTQAARSLPDVSTLEAIANYQGQTLSELISIIEDEATQKKHSVEYHLANLQGTVSQILIDNPERSAYIKAIVVLNKMQATILNCLEQQEQ